MLDRLVERDNDLQFIFGSLQIAQRFINHRHVIERDAFSPPVADLPSQRQRLLEEVERLAFVAQGGIDLANIGERRRFAAPVADLPISGSACS